MNRPPQEELERVAQILLDTDDWREVGRQMGLGFMAARAKYRPHVQELILPHIPPHPSGRPHGNPWTYSRWGCRCEPCRWAYWQWCYAARLKKRRGMEPYVDASKARDHILWLNSPVGRRMANQFWDKPGLADEWWFSPGAKQLGVESHQLYKIADGRIKKIRTKTGRAIMKLNASSMYGRLMPPEPALALVAALVDRGWTKAAIARRIGKPMLQIAKGPGGDVLRSTFEALEAIVLSGEEPPPDPLRERNPDGTWKKVRA